MKKILLVVIAVSIVITSVFTGCGSGGEGPNTKDKITKLDIWWDKSDIGKDVAYDAWWSFKDACKEKGSELYEKYGDIIDGISFDPLSGSSGDKTALESLILAGLAPAIVKMDHVYISSLGADSNIYDLADPRFNANDIKDLFIDSCWQASISGAAVYGLPFDANTVIWGARKSYLSDAGVSLPQTWEQLLDYGSKMKAKDFDRSVYALPCGTATDAGKMNWTVFVWLFYVWRLGGNVLNSDNTEAIFNDPETGVKAFKMMQELREQGLVSTEKYEEFDAVISDMGTWRLDGFTDEMEYSTMPVLKENVPGYSGLGLYTMSVTKIAPNPDLAYDFMKFFATGKNDDGEFFQFDYCKKTNLIPSLKEAADKQRSDDENKNDFWNTCVEQLYTTRHRPMVSQWLDIEEELFKAINLVLKEGKDPVETLNTSKKFVDSLLKK